MIFICHVQPTGRAFPRLSAASRGDLSGGNPVRGFTPPSLMRFKHPRVVCVHWSKQAWQTTGESDRSAWRDQDEEEKTAPKGSHTVLFHPVVKLSGPHRWKAAELLAPRQGIQPPDLARIDVEGLTDDVLPVILAGAGGVFLRKDVADFLRPQFCSSQRWLPVCCDGESTSYIALFDPNPAVWLDEDWIHLPCAERGARELRDGKTLVSPIFPDCFGKHGVHFVGNYHGFFINLPTWRALGEAFPKVLEWLETSRIVVDDAL
jgi:hypothetical protein